MSMTVEFLDNAPACRRSIVVAPVVSILPLLEELWRHDKFYLKVLAGRDDVLTPGQVMAIRQLAAQAKDERQIFEIVGARNVDQVKRVLTGKTYKRIS
jgi:hypothetical protein